MQQIEKYLEKENYPGRAILIGKNKTNELFLAYFITGRSANSKNRIFELDENENLVTKPFQNKDLKNKDLILYTAVTKFENKIIISNGNHTKTILNEIKQNKNFEESLKNTTYEDDPPIFTPRISAILEIKEEKQKYIFSIIKKSITNSTARFFFEFDPITEGSGHMIHTYKQQDNDMTHSFNLEPIAIKIPETLDEFTNSIWNSLNLKYKISLFSCSINIKTKKQTINILNINK